MIIIYLDFDGTVVEHAYPNMGGYNPESIRVIKRLIDKGYRIILNTMRVEFNNGTLMKALKYLKDYGVEIKEHTGTKITPTSWPASLILGDVIFIDDVAEGMPLIRLTRGYGVDWKAVEADLININKL